MCRSEQVLIATSSNAFELNPRTASSHFCYEFTAVCGIESTCPGESLFLSPGVAVAMRSARAPTISEARNIISQDSIKKKKKKS